MICCCCSQVKAVDVIVEVVYHHTANGRYCLHLHLLLLMK